MNLHIEHQNHSKWKQQTTTILEYLIMINCQSIRNEKSVLRECVEYIKPDIIIGCESWLSSEHKNADIFPDSYQTNVYRKDRNN